MVVMMVVMMKVLVLVVLVLVRMMILPSSIVATTWSGIRLLKRTCHIPCLAPMPAPVLWPLTILLMDALLPTMMNALMGLHMGLMGMEGIEGMKGMHKKDIGMGKTAMGTNMDMGVMPEGDVHMRVMDVGLNIGLMRISNSTATWLMTFEGAIKRIWRPRRARVRGRIRVRLRLRLGLRLGFGSG